MKRLIVAAIVLTVALLSGCRQTAPASEEISSDTSSPMTTITAEEGIQVLEDQLGTVDAATGNTMSYGYEGMITLDGTDYYNYRVSWLVNGDHMSYLTNYLVSTDGLVVQEYLPESLES
jgi:hypothetical protein